jgi:NO-binding membrane sensor protein with MHYT domain
MNVGILSSSSMTLALAFAFSSVGCVLAVYSFALAIKPGSPKRRFWWLFLGAWALAASAVWDMFFVAAIDLHTGGLQIRYDIISIVASVAGSVVVSTLLLWLFVARARMLGILVCGAIVGGVMALDCLQVLTAIRVNAVVTIRTPTAIAVVMVLAIATAPALWFAVRSTRHAVLSGTAISLALAMTAAHYLGLHAITISQPLGRPVTEGIIPTAVILPIALILFLRILVLLLVLLANTSTTESSMLETGPKVPTLRSR